MDGVSWDSRMDSWAHATPARRARSLAYSLVPISPFSKTTKTHVKASSAAASTTTSSSSSKASSSRAFSGPNNVKTARANGKCRLLHKVGSTERMRPPSSSSAGRVCLAQSNNSNNYNRTFHFTAGSKRFGRYQPQPVVKKNYIRTSASSLAHANNGCAGLIFWTGPGWAFCNSAMLCFLEPARTFT